MERKGVWVTLGGVATAVGIATAVAPYFPSFQTVEAAEAHAEQDAKALTLLAHGQAHILTIVLRAQVNACVVESSRLKGDERLTCDGYRREYEQAERKMQTLYRATLKSTNQEKQK